MRIHNKEWRRGSTRAGGRTDFQSFPQPRRGFTLVELLVVVAIIVVLISLTTAAVMRFRVVGYASATRTNLSKIRSSLGTQWRSVRDKAAEKRNEPAFEARALSRSGALTMQESKAKEWYDRLKLMQAFPTTFSEALAPDGQTNLAWPAYVQHLNSLGINAGNSNSWPGLDVQHSICLLMILEKGPYPPGLTRDDLGNSAVALVPLSPLSGDAHGVVDAWRQPILFTRTYNGQDASPALLSCGNDGRFGVDVTTFVTTNPEDARDNVLIVNP